MPASPSQKEHAMERVAKAYAILKRAAEMGDECPSNKVLCERLGWASTSNAADALSFLHTAGMIEVQRMNHTRVVTIVATGRKTAGSPGKPHHSARLNAARRTA